MPKSVPTPSVTMTRCVRFSWLSCGALASCVRSSLERITGSLSHCLNSWNTLRWSTRPTNVRNGTEVFPVMMALFCSVLSSISRSAVSCMGRRERQGDLSTDSTFLSVGRSLIGSLLSLVCPTRERSKEKRTAANPNSARPCASSPRLQGFGSSRRRALLLRQCRAFPFTPRGGGPPTVAVRCFVEMHRRCVFTLFLEACPGYFQSQEGGLFAQRHSHLEGTRAIGQTRESGTEWPEQLPLRQIFGLGAGEQFFFERVDCPFILRNFLHGFHQHLEDLGQELLRDLLFFIGEEVQINFRIHIEEGEHVGPLFQEGYALMDECSLLFEVRVVLGLRKALHSEHLQPVGKLRKREPADPLALQPVQFG